MMTWNKLKFWKNNHWDSMDRDESEDGTKIFPPVGKRYRAFELTPFEEVKVVILGQDPYHSKGMANGLAFSVPAHVKVLPPSLKNIFKEYQADLGFGAPKSGDLTPWAERGVFLFNTILTVEDGRPLSHAGIGWEKLTYEVLRTLSDKKENLVFMLWGKKAQEYTGLIDGEKHLILSAPHPSPLSGGKGFLGCRHFSKANAYLKEKGCGEIDWKLP